MTVEVRTEGEGWSCLPGRNGIARRAVQSVVSLVGQPQEDLEVSILFTDDARVAALNETWRGKQGPTNVLSFPNRLPAVLPSGMGRPLGDIVLASGVIAAEAASTGKPLASHVSHLIVHGLLHLLGHHHDEEESAGAMRAIEAAAQRSLGFQDPYAEDAHGASRKTEIMKHE